MRVIAIGAHPDDLELGVYGTLAKHHKRGDSILLVILSDGEIGGDRRKRREEARAAARLIKARTVFAGLREGYVHDDFGIVKCIEDVVRKFKPDIAYLHSIRDRHQDHRNAGMASISATRFVPEAYMYETPSVLQEFIPQIFVDITDEFKLKLRAVKQHRSQKDRIYMRERMLRGLALFRAYQGSMHGRMAECFQVVRIVKK